MEITFIKTLGDALAIFGFLALIVYFRGIPKRSRYENLLLVFSIIGFIADTFFTVYELLH